MVNRRYTLSKEERLSWKRYIDLLFAKGQSFVAFPLRVVYLAVEEETLAPVSILVSVPKKKFWRAVKRKESKKTLYHALSRSTFNAFVMAFSISAKGWISLSK